MTHRSTLLHVRTLGVSISRLTAASLLLAAASSSAIAQQYEQLGCVYHVRDNKWWLGAIGLDAKATDPKFYEDKAGFAFSIKAGDSVHQVTAADVAVNIVKALDFKDAEKFKLVKYSLVVDYSGSIPGDTREQVVAFLSDFVEKLPLAVEGQVVRFSSDVQKSPFTTSKREIQAQLHQPMVYGMTSLHDALMQSALSLVREGGDVPVKVIVLFTDGFENSSTEYHDRDNFLSSFTNLVKTNNINVLAIGVSPEQDKDLLTAVTDKSRGIFGYYLNVPDFAKFGPAVEQMRTILSNVVIFRLPHLGPDKGTASISLVETSRTSGRILHTLHTFECDNRLTINVR